MTDSHRVPLEMSWRSMPAWSGDDRGALFGVGKVGQYAGRDEVGGGRVVIGALSQSQHYQAEPVGLDRIAVLLAVGVLHVAPFWNELLGEFSVTITRFFTSTIRSIASADNQIVISRRSGDQPERAGDRHSTVTCSRNCLRNRSLMLVQ